MTNPLQLRYDPALEAAPEAGFLPGSSVEHWLEELARCGLATETTRLYVVPHPRQSNHPAGLLVVPAGGHSEMNRPPGMACRSVAGRLYVPVDAGLHPPVTDAELQALCPWPAAFFHPAFGLSGFNEESTLRISELLQPPEEQFGEWNAARPGLPAMPELSAVVLLQPPSLEDVFGDANTEIASEPLENLPPAPNEPKTGMLSKFYRRVQMVVARGVAGVLRWVPHTAVRRNWLNDVEDWATRQLHRVTGELDQLRNRELHRLLHLLDTDPESGLRHALPLHSFGHRGVGPPSNRLGVRSLDFQPDRLGGRPADFWNEQPDMENVLRRRYREMADREMQLGRHQRAAYIYAELLGDLVSAASALKRGHLFREAALLYDEHLQNPMEAAQCLADGGFLAEAIERYEKLDQWLRVADLQEKAGNGAAAETALRRVVEERLAGHDVLGAARLVEERLHAPEDALSLLLGAWPASHQAVHCLTAAFDWMARGGEHERARQLLGEVHHQPMPGQLTLPLVVALGGVAREFPHEAIRHQAADFSRVLVARELRRPALSGDTAGRLLEQLVRLAPSDQLLARDANRHLAARRHAERQTPSVIVRPPPAPGGQPTLLRRFELPRQMRWVGLKSRRQWFYALGCTAQRLTLLRGVWDGSFQSLSWDCPAPVAQHGLLLEPMGGATESVVLAHASGRPFASKRFPAADQSFDEVCVAGTPSWLPTQGYPFAIGSETVWAVHVAAGRAVLSGYDKGRGQLMQTRDVTDDLLKEATRTEDTHLSVVALDHGVAIALGNRLIMTRTDGNLTRVELPGQVIRMVATVPNTKQGVAVLLHDRAVMCWAGTDDCMDLERDLVSPIAAFVPGGPLVLASGSRIVLLDMDSRGVQRVTRMTLDGERIMGVSGNGNPGEFAVLRERGEMAVYRMPR